MKTNIAVLFGGNSVEHEISIISSMQAIENINKEKYNIIPIYITKNLEMYSDESFFSVDPFVEFDASKYKQVQFIKNGSTAYIQEVKGLIKRKETRIDIAFPIVHGTGVEDGTLQGYLKMFNIPIVGPTVLSGAIGQDKAVMKDILSAHNISQTDYLWLTSNGDNENIKQVEANIKYPVIIKPASLGSSVGIEVCQNQIELEAGLNNCFNYDHKVVVENALSSFEEYNISIFSSSDKIETSVIERVLKTDEFLSYDQKYMSGGKKAPTKSSGMASLSREVPANISKELATEIEKQAVNSYRALNCSGLVRFDIIVSNDGAVYINEVNSIPGSLSYYLWEASGIRYGEMLDKMIEAAVQSFYKDEKLINSFDTNVLNMQKSGAKC